MTSDLRVDPDYTPTTHQPSRSNTIDSKGLSRKGYALVALGIIILIGSLVAAGCLYAQVGYWSLALGSAGLFVGLGLIAIGLCRCKKSSQPSTDERVLSGNLSPLGPSEASPVNTLENDDKESPSHRLIKPTKVPIRASDIILPEILPEPKEIEPKYIWGTEWLDNNHISYYFRYLATLFSEVAILPPGDYRIDYFDALMRLILEERPKEIPDFNDLNIPIWLRISGNHFTLVFIDRKKRTVEYFDSKKNYGNQSEIDQKLSMMANALSKQEPNKPPYKFVRKIEKVLQPDSFQCGAWVMYFLESRLIDPEFDFNKLDINEARDLIKKYRIKAMLKVDEVEYVSDRFRELSKYRQYYEGKKTEEQITAIWRADRKKFSASDLLRLQLNGGLEPGH
jgi:hypothetical protein